MDVSDIFLAVRLQLEIKKCDTVAHNTYSWQNVLTMFLTFGPSLSLHGLSLSGRKYSS